MCLYSGRPNENFLKAKVVGRDDARDLAILFVPSKRLPEPIDSTPTKELYETLPVNVFGFPFGEIFTTTQRSPDITVTRSSISALRRDEHDQLAFLQLDGGINPGNSGGPVVTEDGKLLGVAVAKLLGTEIGLAIPRRELKLALEGNLASLEFQPAKDGNGTTVLRLQPRFIDPRGRIESARLLTCKAGRIDRSEPNGDGSWVRVLQEMDEYPLDLNVPVTFYPPSFEARNWAWQVEWTYKDGQKRASKPVIYDPKVLTEQKSESPESNDGPVDQSLVGKVETSAEPLSRTSAGSFSVIKLPDLMRDFAINPANGDIASVSPFANHMFLYRADGLIENESRATSVTIGSRPSGIVFKKFGDLETFVAICPGDENMYVINAADASLVKQVPLALRWPVDVFASSNDEDPYVYYTTKDRQLAAVDVREFKDRGRLLYNIAHGALSADGKILYRADGLSPSGFESLELVTDFSKPIPEFERIFYGHRDSGIYVPDSFGTYTACRKKVYSARLNSTVAELDFIAGCSFKSVPILAGIEASELVLASYNTLSSVGDRIPLPDVLSRGTINLFGEIPQLDVPQTRLLADDHNQRLVYAAGNHLGIVPLSKFDIKPEPYLTLVSSHSTCLVGKQARIEIAAIDRQVTVAATELPDGATFENGFLVWTPKSSDVGTITIQVTLSYDDVQRTVPFTIRVSQPVTQAPFDCEGIAVDGAGKYAACWSTSSSTEANVRRDAVRLAIVPLDGDAESVEKVLPYRIESVTFLDGHVAVLQSETRRRIEVFDRDSLERVKTLLSPSPVKSIRWIGGKLLVCGALHVDIYSQPDLELLQTIGVRDGGRGTWSTDWTHAGLLAGGMLLDEETLQPKLWLSPGMLPTIPGADRRLYAGSFLPRNRPVTPDRHPPNKTVLQTRIRLPGQPGFTATAGGKSRRAFVPGSIGTVTNEREVILTLFDPNGSTAGEIVVLRENPTAGVETGTPILAANGNYDVVALGRRIFEVDLEDEELPFTERRFYVEPRQSAFVISGDVVEMSHSVIGGREPYEFFLFSEIEGVAIDESSGVLKLPHEILKREAATAIKSRFRTRETIEQELPGLQSDSFDFVQPLFAASDQKPTGIPVAAPVHIKVVDARGDIAEFQYFVLVELSTADVLNLFQDEQPQ